MNEKFPPNENSGNTNDNIDKTVDESAMVSPANYNQTTDKQSEKNLTGLSHPYQRQELPSGKEAIKLGSGTIAGILGAGGMARVYKIWNEKLEVYRAVKILLPNSPKDLSKRFDTEVKITAKLHHPNIVEIYSVGEWNGLPYIEMEIVDGVTLDTLVAEQGRLPAAVCSAIGIQIAKALAYAHNQEFLIYGKIYKGVIHRDLKPANIMISNSGDLKLMDFGIARPTEVGLHTTDGHIVGTLQYLSPEQLDGTAIDNGADIYSFGTILYETLTGTKTFPQSTITNIMRMKATNKYRKFNEFNFPVSVSLAKACEKCLQFNRNRRYENADTLLNDLGKTHESLSSDSPSVVLQKYIQNPDSYLLKSLSKKNMPIRYLLVGSGVVALLAIIILIVTLLPIKNPKDITQNKKNNLSAKPDSKVSIMKEATVESTKVIVSKDHIKEQPSLSDKATIKKQYARSISKKPKKLSPVTQLKKKYGSKNLVYIGEKACEKGNYSEAITALEASPGKNPKKSIYLLWAYVETRKLNKAQNLSASLQSEDAFTELLKGRIEAAVGNSRKAINHYQAALTRPSAIKNRTTIRNDALYYTALVHDKHYRQSPSAETRLHALTAWNNLKRVYNATPDHPRFKLSNKKLATIN